MNVNMFLYLDKVKIKCGADLKSFFFLLAEKLYSVVWPN